MLLVGDSSFGSVWWWRDMIRSTGLAPATVERYVGDADRFVAWLEGQDADATPADVTAQDAREYRAHLLRAKRAPATINRALKSGPLLGCGRPRGRQSFP